MGIRWTLNPEYAQLAPQFGSIEKVFSIQGERLTRSPISEVIRIEHQGQRYYIKRYWQAGKGLRRWLGRPRIVSEWENLQQFAAWDIPTPSLVAWGCERKSGLFVRGAMISLEIPDTIDLATLAHNDDSRLRDNTWLELVTNQLALYTRKLHDHHFMHNDLKWRNILVDDQGRVFFIDCPAGRFWSRPFLEYRIVKDLACIDKVAKYYVPRSARLRFYLRYKGHDRLRHEDKLQLRRVLKFFEGRE
jgi:hypothetical protein